MIVNHLRLRYEPFQNSRSKGDTTNMKIQEFGCRDCPIILLIEDSRFPVKNPEKLFHDYFLIVATHEEEQDTEARDLIRYISGHYHNPIFLSENVLSLAE